MAGSRVSRDEIGYIPYAEVVVRRMRKERRGFVNAKYAANLRRSEVVGWAEEKADNCAEASGGMTASGEVFSEPDSFKRFLRRCGNSFCVASAAIGPDDAASVELVGLAEVLLAGWEMEGLDGPSALADAKDEINPPFNPVAS
jgi:hypothetical protein